jgi:hypothetical protein
MRAATAEIGHARYALRQNHRFQANREEIFSAEPAHFFDMMRLEGR